MTGYTLSADQHVAFQGAHYAFSEIAAQTCFGRSVQTMPCRTFDDVFARVDSGDARLGIVPVENSLTGSIHRTYDLLLEFDLKIVGETFLRIEQHLISLPGTRLQDIQTIYSHPQALEQCRRFLTGLTHVETVASYDTAGSVKLIRDHQYHDSAAIASERAARDYGMEIVQREIEDDPQNYTRFLIIAKEPILLGSLEKTSIVFSMKSIPGALFKCLSVFALRDIDLLKIESRPLRGKPWDYIFYLSFAGHMDEERCQNAVRHLQEITEFMTVLGSYPMLPKTKSETN
jgi:prephenate dehydratase